MVQNLLPKREAADALGISVGRLAYLLSRVPHASSVLPGVTYALVDIEVVRDFIGRNNMRTVNAWRLHYMAVRYGETLLKSRALPVAIRAARAALSAEKAEQIRIAVLQLAYAGISPFKKADFSLTAYEPITDRPFTAVATKIHTQNTYYRQGPDQRVQYIAHVRHIFNAKAAELLLLAWSTHPELLGTIPTPWAILTYDVRSSNYPTNRREKE